MIDLVLERGEDVIDQFMDLAVGFGRIVPLDVDLTDCLAKGVVDEGDPALPAIALRRHVGQGLAVEIEAGVIERLGQKLRVIA